MNHQKVTKAKEESLKTASMERKKIITKTYTNIKSKLWCYQNLILLIKRFQMVSLQVVIWQIQIQK